LSLKEISTRFYMSFNLRWNLDIVFILCLKILCIIILDLSVYAACLELKMILNLLSNAYLNNMGKFLFLYSSLAVYFISVLLLTRLNKLMLIL